MLRSNRKQSGGIHISCYYYVCDLSYFDVVLCPLEPNPGNFILPLAQSPSVLVRFARSGSQSHPL